MSDRPVVVCDVEKLPEALKRLPQWVVWNTQPRESGKPAKVPYDPRSGAKAKSDDVTTWATFHAARAAYVAAPDRWHGLGFYFWRSDPFIGIDLDDAQDENGYPRDWAVVILQKFPGAYTEISQSGRGLHIIVRAKSDQVFGAGKDGGKKGNVEVYAGRHYLALTGNTVEADRSQILDIDCTAAVVELCGAVNIDTLSGDLSEHATKTPITPVITTPSFGEPATTDQLQERIDSSRDADRFFGLMEGDSSPQKASEEDLQLAIIAARQTRNEDLIVEMMAQSARKRVKWSEKRPGGITWLRMTVRRALSRTSRAQGVTAIPTNPFTNFDELVKAPPASLGWLIDGIWPTGARGWISGEAKLGKSWLAIDMAIALCTGSDFLLRAADDAPRFAVRAPGRVLYLTEESNHRKIYERVLMLLAGRNLTWADLRGRLEIVVRKRVKLTNPLWLNLLLLRVDETKPLITIVDPLRRYHDGNENDATEVAPVLDAAARLQDAGTAPVLIHHTRKQSDANQESRSGQMLRGSSDLHAWGDAALYVTGAKGLEHGLQVEVELKDEEGHEPFTVMRTFDRKERVVAHDQTSVMPMRLIIGQGDMHALKVRTLSEALLLALKSLRGGERLSVTELKTRVKAKNEDFAPALAALRRDGKANVIDGPRGRQDWAASSITPEHRDEAPLQEPDDDTPDL